MSTQSMRTFLLLLCFAACSAYGDSCPSSARATVDELYAALTGSDAPEKAAQNALAEDAFGSACWLVHDLHEIKAVRVTAQAINGAEYRPILAIRGLRLITNCHDERAPLTQPTMVDPRQPRWGLLLAAGIQEVPFFATWMSRDEVFLAPPEVQRQIISSWSNWLSHSASGSAYGLCGNIDKWYP